LNRKNPFKNFTIDVLCYRGTANEPKWVDVEPRSSLLCLSLSLKLTKVFEDMYTKLCTIMADASSAAKLQDSSSSRHYTLNFSVVLLFGLTEFKAQVCWKENVSRLILILTVYSYFFTKCVMIRVRNEGK